MVGMCVCSTPGLLDRRLGSAADGVCRAGGLFGPPASVCTLVEEYSPCCGTWLAAAASGSVRVPCFLVPVWCPALHPRGMRAASVPARCEWSEGASMCAGGGTNTGWWPLVASRGVMACCLPWGLRHLLGLWSPVSRGVSLGAQGHRAGPDVVPLHGCTDTEGRVLVPQPV